jgi:hypothetical protein
MATGTGYRMNIIGAVNILVSGIHGSDIQFTIGDGRMAIFAGVPCIIRMG